MASCDHRTVTLPSPPSTLVHTCFRFGCYIQYRGRCEFPVILMFQSFFVAVVRERMPRGTHASRHAVFQGDTLRVSSDRDEPALGGGGGLLTPG